MLFISQFDQHEDCRFDVALLFVRKHEERFHQLQVNRVSIVLLDFLFV